MKALARYGKEFGGYRMIDVPEPECGPEDIIIEGIDGNGKVYRLTQTINK